MVCKVYKENEKELEKCTTSVVCVSYELILIYNKNKQGKIDFISTVKIDRLFS